jgi:16S rRNA (cytosine967-C5)-methyltransferase
MHVTENLSRSISPARQVAWEVLAAVEAGAYASDSLRDRARGLESRDAGLASQIVFGCLRVRAQLDYLIWYYSHRRFEQLDQVVVLPLRMAIFQLRYLERIPSHAAVHEAVEMVKARRRAAAGLVNAVLRKVDRRPVRWPDKPTELSCPAWLLDRWSKHFGPELAESIARAALLEPAAYVRLRVPPEPAASGFEPTSVPGCYRLLAPPAPGTRLHDISSQAILPLLELEPGHMYLDLCAAPGNKTLQALETSLSLAIACDISPKRLAEVPPVCPRVILDASEELPFRQCFDRVFVDAPCSGTGTLARNPEIKWRVQEQDFARFRAKQQEILRRAAGAVVSRGKLLYATCSLELEENEKVVHSFLSWNAQFRLEREQWRIPGREEGDGFYAALLVRVS